MSLFASYYLSYRAVTKNFSLIYSKLECSKALVKINFSKKLLFAIDTDEKDPLKVCKIHSEEIIDKLIKHKIIVNSTFNRNDKIKIIFLPHLFDIIIKNNIAYFYIKGD